MPHKVNIHSAQTSILRELLFRREAGFSELQKPTHLDSDHFKFHIKKLVDLGLVKKKSDHKYTLTTEGKEHANKLDTDTNTIERQPKISVALIVENNEGKYLSQQRLKQPYFGFWGRPTGKIRWGETFIDAAARELIEETGLTADLSVAGFYHKMDYRNGGEMLEDKLFCIVYGTNPRGTLIVDDEGHHNEWLSLEEIIAKDKVFESVAEVTDIGSSGGLGFIEQNYYYDESDY